jgi:phosphoenolpyruvate phosphomutase
MMPEYPSIKLDTRSELVGVGAYDALTGALVEEAGFDIAWVGSFEVSTNRRLPDINVLTFSEMAGVVRAVRSSCGLPILVDGDNGYGSDECALRAIEMFAEAGAAAMCIEDNMFPKRNSLYNSRERQLEDPAVFCRRLEKLAHSGSQLTVIARTEALVAGQGPAEAVRRLRQYASAGADALFVQVNGEHRAQLPMVLDQVAGLLPVVLAPTAIPEPSVAEFHRMGANVVLFANVVSRTAIRAVTRMLAQLRDVRSLAGVADHVADLDEVFRLTGALPWSHG